MSPEHNPAPAPAGDTPSGETAADRLDPDGIIGEAACRKITDLGKATRWRLMRQGLFPKKIKLTPTGTRSGWRVSAVLEWLEAREAA